MRIITIPVLSDNYAYLVVDEATAEAAVVDPVEPSKVLDVVKANNVTLKHLITTHHHSDHAGGNEDLIASVENTLEVYGGDERIPGLTRKVADGEEFRIGQRIVAKALHTACHTSGSVSFYLVDGDDRAVFTGDTLFIGGCGRFFEGTAEQMHNSLNNVLAGLPHDTKVYCGHEYTASNLKFAAHVDPENQALQAKMLHINGKVQTVPSTIGDELSFNPFMRVMHDTLKKATGKSDPVEVMSALRVMKNNF